MIATNGVVDLRSREFPSGETRIELEGSGFDSPSLGCELFVRVGQLAYQRLPLFGGDSFPQPFSRKRGESQSDEEHQDDGQTGPRKNAIEDEGYQSIQNRLKQILIEEAFDHGVCPRMLLRERMPRQSLGK